MRLHTDRRFLNRCLLIFAAALILGGGALFAIKGGFAPARQTAAEPTPSPASTPSPTPEASAEHAPATESPEPLTPPEQKLPVKAAISEEALFYAEDAESVKRAMERALAYYTELALRAEPGGTLVSAAYAEEPALLPLGEGEETAFLLDEEGVFALLTAPDSPLRASVTLRSFRTEPAMGAKEESRSKNLLKGMRAILDMGRAGEVQIACDTVYINGEPGACTEGERVMLREPRSLTILNGRLSIPDQKEEPGRSEGEEGPDEGELDFDSPIKGKVISNFGGRRGAWHHGLDYSFKDGAEAVASEAGTVAAAMDWGGYGLTVEIDHGNGFTTRYAHLAEIYIAVGQTVEKGTALGLAGSTGNAEEAHLHFELRVNGMAYNPRYYID